MHTLPAIVPEGEFPRSEVVAVRLARKVAPLFGVRWAHNPFSRTWVCDFGSLTLAEIARGAPLPSKEERVLIDAGAGGVSGRPMALESQGGTIAAGTPACGWGWSGRAVWAPDRTGTPGALANATLNRFGPNTKAAVVLTAANTLLDEVTEAIASVCRCLNEAPVSPRVRLAIWAGLVLEVFRGQPALVVAAIQARAVQRSLTTHWGAQVGIGVLGLTSARCEIGGSDANENADPWHPTRLNLIDDTLAVLDFSDVTVGAVGPDRREDIAAAWGRRLLQMGRPGSGMVWLAEDAEGHRVAHSYQRVGAMVAPFVAEVLDAEGLHGPEAAGSGRFFTWPADQLQAASPMVIRAHAVAAHVAVNYLRYTEETAPDFRTLRERTRELIARSASTTVTLLGPDDPASLLLTSYSEYLNLWDQARSGGPASPTLVAATDALLAGQQRTVAAWHAGRLDPGTASYLLEIGNVAVGKVREQVTPSIPILERALTRSWRDVLTTRGVDPEPASRLDELNGSQIFHLANYAGYLATKATASDLRRSLRIFEAVTEVRERVAANEPAALPAKHAAARDAHQTAAEVAARLAVSLPPRERSARAAAWAAAARHALAVLADPSTEELNASSSDDMIAVWAARQIQPALSQLLNENPDGWPVSLRPAAIRLLTRAQVHLREPAESGDAVEADAGLDELHARLTRLGVAEESRRLNDELDGL